MEVNTQTYSLAKVVKYYAEYSRKLQKPEEAIYQLLENQLKEIRMLDIGVGGGRTTPYFAPKVKEYVGIDFSEGMILSCKEKFKTSFPNARFETCDVRDLSHFKNASFDLVLFSFNGLDNINHNERIKVLQEIQRITSSGGILLFFFSQFTLSSFVLQN